MEKELDLRGLFCPMPVLRAREEMDKSKIGDLLIIMADDPAAEEDLKRWVNRTGQEIVDVKNPAGEVVMTIRKVK
jgi:TusA-related sulfurtransferase